MQLSIFQIDAFAERRFQGNPAAVCILPYWLNDGLLQSIAAENNLSETAFLVVSSDTEADYELRWFTPTTEVALCGHATLAAAHWYFNEGYFTETDQETSGESVVRFSTASGLLTCAQHAQGIAMQFPATSTEPTAYPAGLSEILLGSEEAGEGKIREIWQAGEDCLLRLDSEPTLRACRPDFPALGRLLGEKGIRGLMITSEPELASGSPDTLDFVARFFAPSLGIDEDPVTGSAFCALAPFWAERLNAEDLGHQKQLVGYQASARGGRVICELTPSQVTLIGSAVTYLVGQIIVSD